MRTLLIILASVLLSVFVMNMMHTQKDGVSQSKESAYDRVMRTGTIRCGYALWPPYYEIDPNTKQLSGLHKELTDSIGALLGLKIEYVESVFGQQVIDLQSGKIDAHCFDAPIVYQTMKYLDYSRPFYFTPSYLYVSAQDYRFKTVADLNTPNATFLAMDGDLSLTLAQEQFPKAKISTRPANDPTMVMNDVALKKGDAIIMDPYSAEGFNKSNPDHALRRLGDALMMFPVVMTTEKGDERLLNTLSTAISVLHDKGTIERIIRAYDPQGTNLILPARNHQTP